MNHHGPTYPLWRALHWHRLVHLATTLGLLGVMAALHSGCAIRQLRKPASELHQQAQMIRDGCERDGYPSTFCNEETLQVLTESTCAIEAIANGEDGEGCVDELH